MFDQLPGTVHSVPPLAVISPILSSVVRYNSHAFSNRSRCNQDNEQHSLSALSRRCSCRLFNLPAADRDLPENNPRSQASASKKYFSFVSDPACKNRITKLRGNKRPDLSLWQFIIGNKQESISVNGLTRTSGHRYALRRAGSQLYHQTT